VKGPDHTTFRTLLTDFMQSAVTQRQVPQKIEIDLVFRLALVTPPAGSRPPERPSPKVLDNNSGQIW